MASSKRSSMPARGSDAAPALERIDWEAAREGLHRALDTTGRWSRIAGRHLAHWSVVGARHAVRWGGIAACHAARWSRIGARYTAEWSAFAARRFADASLAFWRTLRGEGEAPVPAARRHARSASSAAPTAVPLPTPTLPPALDRVPTDSALLLLGLFQTEGRLVDFLQQDVGQYSDQEVGAAARVVHQGCRKVLRDYLEIAPVREESEGSAVTLDRGFDPAAVRPTGQVVGEPPFTGTLVHRGWRATQVRLPQVASGRDLAILAAAEVEL